jgi:hypothetical protein
MPNLFHKAQTVQGMSKTEVAVLDFFDKTIKKDNKPMAKMQFLYGIINGTDAEPKEVVKAVRALHKSDFLTEYGRDDNEHRLMYEITDAGIAAYSKVQVELKGRAEARGRLSRIPFIAHLSRK